MGGGEKLHDEVERWKRNRWVSAQVIGWGGEGYKL